MQTWFKFSHLDLNYFSSSVYKLIIIGQIACPDFSSGESRMVHNHPPV